MLITASPTFEAISDYASQCGAQTVAVPLDHQYSHELDAMLAKVNDSTTLVYICNPNNPTGSITPRQSIEQFVAKLPPEVIVVVDEAYHHFALRSSMYVSFLDQPLDDKRVIVLRTFSKAFGLAGLRVGYAVTSPELAARLRPQVTDTGISELGLQAALAALDDEAGLRLAVKRNADDRQEFFNQTHARMLRPIYSQTNFVMVNAERPAVDRRLGECPRVQRLVRPLAERAAEDAAVADLPHERPRVDAGQRAHQGRTPPVVALDILRFAGRSNHHNRIPFRGECG
jgi:histidinol-phosphate aminotransferase